MLIESCHRGHSPIHSHSREISTRCGSRAGGLEPAQSQCKPDLLTRFILQSSPTHRFEHVPTAGACVSTEWQAAAVVRRCMCRPDGTRALTRSKGAAQRSDAPRGWPPPQRIQGTRALTADSAILQPFFRPLLGRERPRSG